MFVGEGRKAAASVYRQRVKLEMEVEDDNLSDSRKPYNKAFKTLRQISHSKSVLSKLYLILRVKRQILDAITKFWQEQTGNVDVSDELILNRDDYLSIFIYVLAQARPQFVHAEMELLREFTTEFIQVLHP
jgi:hypothetical protein